MLFVFVIIGIFVTISSVACAFIYWSTFNFKELSGYLTVLGLFCVLIFSLMFAIISGLSLKEIETTEDSNFISSMFSSIIALVALIVAVIALFKDFG